MTPVIRRRPSPPRDRAAWGGPLAAAAFAAGVGAGVARAEGSYPRPWAAPGEVRDYFAVNARSARIGAAGQLASAVGLAAFTRAAARLAGRAGAPSGALRTASAAGGALAAGALALSGACFAALGTARGRDEATAARLHRAAFRAGGPVHGAGFGLLCGAVSLAGRRTGELPRGVTAVGLAAGAAGIASPVALAWRPAMYLIPAGRFPGLLVSALAGARLARGG
jgi:hypothetical protein